jgi:hypothetical protein
MPPNLQLYGGTREVVKLAQAGVDDGVILSYITNANVRFGVTSDQIIYLNDLGVSAAAVTAMMQHDAAMNAMAAATPPASTTSAPPTEPGMDYSSPPTQTTADTGPVAPQPDSTDYAGYDGSNPDDVAVADDADYFYDSLQPYGSWIYLTGYGMCWQPTVCARDHEWRPYCDRGRWLYSDCGWYWQSDYSWGWAAFHYGRWFCDDRRGWVWLPNRVWGPAWVAWRESGEYAGWAPLPPVAVFIPGRGLRYHNREVGADFDFGLRAERFTFIPTERLADYAPSRYTVAPWQAGRVFSESKALNGVTVENHQLANHGLDPQEVDVRAGVRVRRAVIQQVNGTDANGRVQPDRLGIHGGSLVIYRPQLPTVPSQHLAGTSTMGTLMEMREQSGFTPGAGATRIPLNASPASPARMPTVFGTTAYPTAGSADGASHAQAYYVTHQDPRPAAPATTSSSASYTTTPSGYAPNQMVLVGPRNLTQPQWEEMPSQGQSSGMQLRYNRPAYAPNATPYPSAPGRVETQPSHTPYVIGGGAYGGNQQRSGASSASYENSYRPSQGVAAAPGPGRTYDAPRNDYRQPAYAPPAPSRPEPVYREQAPEPRENYSAPAAQSRESYSAPAPQQSYSSRNTSYPQSSSSSSSGSNQRR